MSLRPLIELLHLQHPLSDATVQLLEPHITRRLCRKGEMALELHSVCRHIFFVKSGLLRGFYGEDGKDISAWFAGENEIANSLQSFITQTPSLIGIEALEDSELLCISQQALQQLYAQSNEINTAGRLLIERCYIDAEERNRLFQTKTAAWRYEQLIKNNPDLHNRVALGHIASYLGISQERLSRIRAGK